VAEQPDVRAPLADGLVRRAAEQRDVLAWLEFARQAAEQPDVPERVVEESSELLILALGPD
jgi:hypothetical protein